MLGLLLGAAHYVSLCINFDAVLWAKLERKRRQLYELEVGEHLRIAHDYLPDLKMWHATPSGMVLGPLLGKCLVFVELGGHNLGVVQMILPSTHCPV